MPCHKDSKPKKVPTKPVKKAVSKGKPTKTSKSAKPKGKK